MTMEKSNMNPEDPRFQEYRKESDRIFDLRAKNMLATDSVLGQLSVGLLTILGTFGRPLLASNVTLSYFIIIPLLLTVIQVVIGYVLSDIFFGQIQKTYDKNIHSDKQPYDGVDQILEGRLNDYLNIFRIVTFLLGIISFAILLLIGLHKSN